MIGKIFGALIGGALDRRDGDSGIKGAAIGAVTVGLARRLAPVALLLGGAYVAKKLVDQARGRTAESD